MRAGGGVCALREARALKGAARAHARVRGGGQVLYMEDAPDVVSNMLRWLAAFAESEEVETVDVMAGYDLFNRLLLRSPPPPAVAGGRRRRSFTGIRHGPIPGWWRWRRGGRDVPYSVRWWRRRARAEG